VSGQESRALPGPGPRGLRGGGAGGALVSLGEIVSGEILSFSQADSYLFEASRGQWVVVDRIAATTATGLAWRLEDAYGRELASDPSGLDDLGPVPLLGGLYTVVVLPNGTGTGAYEFRVIDATPVALQATIGGAPIAGEIDAEHPGQRHDIHFTADPGTAVFLDRLSTAPTSLDGWLEDARGRTLVARRLFADQGPIVLLGGSYRLSLQGRRSSGNFLGGAYDLAIRSVTSPAPRPIGLNATVDDAIGAAGEVDAFTFSAGAGQIVFLDHLSPLNTTIFNWELTDAAGRAIIPRTGNIGDVGPLALAGGDYTLRVLGEGDATGAYSFRLVDAAPVALPPIALGEEVAGEIPADRPGRVNVYELAVPASRVVTIESLATSNLIGLNWMLEDEHGRAVLPRTGTLQTTAPIALLGGGYTLRVLGEGHATGSYRLRVRDDGAAAPAIAGEPAAVGDEIAGAIANPGGEIRYTFTAAAGQTVFLDLLAGHADLDWELRDPVGTLASLARANSTDLSDLGPHRLAAGDYTVLLRARTATATPLYRFRIADAAPVSEDVEIDDVVSGAFTGAPGAVHAYRFNVDGAGAGQRVFLDTLVASQRLYWTLLDPAGQPVFALTRAESVDEDAGPFPLAGGVYTLVLDPLYGYQPAYQIAIRAADDEEEALPLGATFAGDFAGRAGSSRTALIEVPDGARVFLDRLSTTGRLDWSLIDPVGEPVFALTRLDSGDGDQGPFALGAGTYRLVLDPPDGYQPAYEVRAVAVADIEAPLPFETPVAGTLGAGAAATYSFTAVEGARCFFDLSAGASSLRWSLLDELGQPVFLDARAAAATDDQGPLSLAAGNYRLVVDAIAGNTPSYAFTASNLAVDLSVSEMAVSPRVVFAGDAERAVEVAWTVENLGGGPAPTGAWTDRIVVSRDATLGNADDVLIGDFVRFDTLRPRSSYSRRESVRLPASLGLGQHRLFLAVDAGNIHPETGGEGDNVAVAEISVVEDLPPAEPLFVSTTSFPFDFTARGVGHVLDLPLSRAVPLASVRFVLAEGVSLQLIPTAGLAAECRLTMSLLSGGDEVLEVATVHPSGGGLATYVVRFSRRLTPQVIALLPERTVDGVRFRFDQPSSTDTRMRSIHADGRLYIHFAGCEFAPCGPHLERRATGEEAISIQGTEISAWRVVDFDEPVPGDGLRLVSGPRFTGTTTHSIFSLAFTSSEAQLILDDGRLVTLDDNRSPSTLASPAVTLSVDHSLLVPPGSLAGRQIIGIQWRVRGASTGGASAIYTPLDDLAVRFLYEVEACGGAIDVPPVALEPADGSTFAPGSMVTLAGRALAPQPGREVSAVLVNGQPVDSLDASGRFFKSVRIAEGENLFAIQVVEPGCGEPEALLRLVGVADGASGLSGYAEATAQLRVEYADTSFLRVSDSLLVRARVRNQSALPVRGPILMVIADMLHPTVTLAGAAGVTGGGEPFAVLFESGTLAPGDAGPYVPLVFSNPERLPVRYGVRWLAPADRLPHFQSAPPAAAVIGQEYRYAPSAADPDGDAIVIEIERGPAGMVLDASGVLRWTPGAGDIGSHDVAIAAATALGRATQRWTLTALPESPNRPPYFSSAPSTQAAVGGRWSYDADAVDPDGDAVVFALAEGPAGLTIGAGDGSVAWPFALPGEHRVTVSAADGRGGEAAQSFVIGVGTLPSNPSAPRITSAPATEARVGILFVYQLVASDPDGDALLFELEEGPEGMAVDADRGRIEWTPAADQEGAHAVRIAVEDGRGGETRQRFEVVVRSGGANLPPVIESVPGAFALAGQVYRYQVEAIDPEGEALGFALPAGPAGMAIDAATGVLEWTPLAAAAGSHVVGVEASDPRGAAGRQTFELRVRAANAAPRISSPPSSSATLTAGRVYQHDVEAEDADGDLLRYELASGPAAIDVHPVTGLVTWRTTPGDVGVHDATVRVADCCGGAAQASFAIEVVPDVAPPALEIGFPTSPAPVGAIVQVWVSASDDVAVVSRTLTVECPPDAPRSLALDEIGRASFASPRTGYCTFEATATDPSGNTATAVATLQVGDPEDPLDPHPPVVEILAPSPGSVITAPAHVAATITDATADGRPGSGPITWVVEVAPSGTDAFEEIGRGGGEVTNALLAVFDPTLRPNGPYRVRIVAADGVQNGGIEFEVHVAGELKLGNFTTEFVDLAIPLAGIPIVITRRYDSLDTRSGDFGAGWTLGLPGRVEDAARESKTGGGLVDLLSTEPFAFGTRVSVTLADGRRVGFTFEPRSAGGLFSMFFFPHFRADPGVKETLEVAGPRAAFFMSGGRASQVGVPFNPAKYLVTTKEGVRYTIDEDTGLEHIEDASGNTIEVRPDGLFSSTGVAVAFERDAGGRIARIVEPEAEPGTPPGSLEYAYDDRGNLASFTNQVGAVTQYHYEEPAFPHFLTRVEDPLGRPVIRNAYDEAGRLVGLCGAEGDIATLEGCTTIATNELARILTTTDARGYRADIVFDERGNAVLDRRYLDGGRFVETVRQYDESGNLLTEVDPAGNVWTYTYDERGNELTRTDPLGRVRRMTYGDCPEPVLTVDEAGNETRQTFDDACKLRLREDPLGNITEYRYDEDGIITDVIDPMGNLWTMRRDGSGRPTEVIDSRGGSVRLELNSAGDLVARTDAMGRRSEFEYDAAHRLVREIWDTDPPTVLTYEYNLTGQLVRAADPNVTLASERDAQGRVSRAERTGPSGAPSVSIEYGYDPVGNVVLVADSLGGVTSYSHDGLNRLVSMAQSGAAREKRIEIDYDDASVRTELRRFAELAGTAPVVTTTYLFDCGVCTHGTTGLHHRRSADGSEIHDIDLVRDDLGNITRMEDAEGTHDYVHDGSRRLIEADHPEGGAQPDEFYRYDGAGNRIASHLSARYTYRHSLGEGGNELVEDDHRSYAYDAVGNLIRSTVIATGERTELAYDHRNRLTEVVRRRADGAVASRSTYRYDPLDRRIAATEDGRTVHFFYDGRNPVLVLRDDGSLVSRRLYAREMDQVHADEAGGATRWFLTDHVGTVRDLVGDDGAVLQHYVYDSFGDVLAASASDVENDLRFTAREFSEVTGFYHYRARNYDPSLGRFHARDPEDPFRYDYANSSPLIFIDPTGRVTSAEYTWNSIVVFFHSYGVIAISSVGWISFITWLKLITHDWEQYVP
jgi:RHS repeat-associated protein